jgi:hypothetical protein
MEMEFTGGTPHAAEFLAADGGKVWLIMGLRTAPKSESSGGAKLREFAGIPSAKKYRIPAPGDMG